MPRLAKIWVTYPGCDGLSCVSAYKCSRRRGVSSRLPRRSRDREGGDTATYAGSIDVSDLLTVLPRDGAALSALTASRGADSTSSIFSILMKKQQQQQHHTGQIFLRSGTWGLPFSNNVCR
jgi:hypothetical protein